MSYPIDTPAEMSSTDMSQEIIIPDNCGDVSFLEHFENTTTITSDLHCMNSCNDSYTSNCLEDASTSESLDETTTDQTNHDELLISSTDLINITHEVKVEDMDDLEQYCETVVDQNLLNETSTEIITGDNYHCIEEHFMEDTEHFDNFTTGTSCVDPLETNQINLRCADPLFQIQKIKIESNNEHQAMDTSEFTQVKSEVVLLDSDEPPMKKSLDIDGTFSTRESFQYVSVECNLGSINVINEPSKTEQKSLLIESKIPKRKLTDISPLLPLTKTSKTNTKVVPITKQQSEQLSKLPGVVSASAGNGKIKIIKITKEQSHLLSNVTRIISMRPSTSSTNDEVNEPIVTPSTSADKVNEPIVTPSTSAETEVEVLTSVDCNENGLIKFSIKTNILNITFTSNDLPPKNITNSAAFEKLIASKDFQSDSKYLYDFNDKSTVYKCLYCAFGSTNKSPATLFHHFKNTHGIQILCHNCPQLINITDLKSHLCSDHGYRYASRDSILDIICGIILHRSVPELKCIYCNDCFKNIKALQHHVSSKHNFCYVCSKFFKDSIDLNTHYQCHAKGLVCYFECVECKFGSQNIKLMHDHIKKKCGNFNFTKFVIFLQYVDSSKPLIFCPYCPATCKEISKMYEHIFLHKVKACICCIKECYLNSFLELLKNVNDLKCIDCNINDNLKYMPKPKTQFYSSLIFFNNLTLSLDDLKRKQFSCEFIPNKNSINHANLFTTTSKFDFSLNDLENFSTLFTLRRTLIPIKCVCDKDIFLDMSAFFLKHIYDAGIMTIKCISCGWTSSNICQFLLHLRNTHNLTEYTYNNVITSLGQLISLHIIKNQPVQVFNCLICDLKFYKFSHFLHHVTNFHFICRSCGLHFENLSDLCQHNVKHSQDKIYIFDCQLCSLFFNCLDTFRQHVIKDHSLPHVFTKRTEPLGLFIQFNEYFCPYCPSSCSTETFLKRHITSQHKSVTKCIECEKTLLITTNPKCLSCLRKCEETVFTVHSEFHAILNDGVVKNVKPSRKINDEKIETKKSSTANAIGIKKESRPLTVCEFSVNLESKIGPTLKCYTIREMKITNTCFEEFSNRIETKENPDIQYACRFCESGQFKTTTINTLYEHFEIKHNLKIYCHSCNEVTSPMFLSSMKHHLVNTHKLDFRLVKNFRNFIGFKILDDVNRKKIEICDIFVAETKTHEKFNEKFNFSLIIHIGAKYYVKNCIFSNKLVSTLYWKEDISCICQFCNKSFLSHDKLALHLDSVHQMITYCNKCNSSMGIESMKNHIMVHLQIADATHFFQYIGFKMTQTPIKHKFIKGSDIDLGLNFNISTRGRSKTSVHIKSFTYNENLSNLANNNDTLTIYHCSFCDEFSASNLKNLALHIGEQHKLLTTCSTCSCTELLPLQLMQGHLVNVHYVPEESLTTFTDHLGLLFHRIMPESKGIKLSIKFPNDEPVLEQTSFIANNLNLTSLSVCLHDTDTVTSSATQKSCIKMYSCIVCKDELPLRQISQHVEKDHYMKIECNTCLNFSKPITINSMKCHLVITHKMTIEDASNLTHYISYLLCKNRTYNIVQTSIN